ncbi:MAG: hypothetical protein KTU85_06650 [Acidimicrobiia bacterium]|nr:hypothetical protein [Acidimicrobiia bacterium]MCY4458378.1 hypothetical protein [Acidimicrobiaceae bacterium]
MQLGGLATISIHEIDLRDSERERQIDEIKLIWTRENLVGATQLSTRFAVSFTPAALVVAVLLLAWVWIYRPDDTAPVGDAPTSPQPIQPNLPVHSSEDTGNALTTTVPAPEPVLGDAIGAWDTTSKTSDNGDVATLYPTLWAFGGEEYEFTTDFLREMADEGEVVVPQLNIVQMGAEGCAPVMHIVLGEPRHGEFVSSDVEASFRTTGGKSVTQDWSFASLYGTVLLFMPAPDERLDILTSRVLADADTDGVLYVGFSFDNGQRLNHEFPLDVSDTQTVLDLLDC